MAEEGKGEMGLLAVGMGLHTFGECIKRLLVSPECTGTRTPGQPDLFAVRIQRCGAGKGGIRRTKLPQISQAKAQIVEDTGVVGVLSGSGAQFVERGIFESVLGTHRGSPEKDRRAKQEGQRYQLD